MRAKRVKKLRSSEYPNPGRKHKGITKSITGRSTGHEDRTSGNKFLPKPEPTSTAAKF